MFECRFGVVGRRFGDQTGRLGSVYHRSDTLALRLSPTDGLGEAAEVQKHGALPDIGRDGSRTVESHVLRQPRESGPPEAVTPLPDGEHASDPDHTTAIPALRPLSAPPDGWPRYPLRSHSAIPKCAGLSWFLHKPYVEFAWNAVPAPDGSRSCSRLSWTLPGVTVRRRTNASRQLP